MGVARNDSRTDRQRRRPKHVARRDFAILMPRLRATTINFQLAAEKRLQPQIRETAPEPFHWPKLKVPQPHRAHDELNAIHSQHDSDALHARRLREETQAVIV